MRILHVIDALNRSCGGPPHALASLAKTQAERGDEVIVLPCRGDKEPRTLDPGQYGKLLVYEPPSNSRLLWYDARVKRVLRQAANHCDIVHIHGGWRYHLLGAASVARAYGIPYVIRPAGNLGRIPRRQKQLVKTTYFMLFERPIYNRAAAIQCCSEKERQELLDIHFRARTFVVPQPIGGDFLKVVPDLEQLRSRCPHLQDDDQVILFLGRIAPIKRLEILLEAFIRLNPTFPDWHLILAGPHEDMNVVRHLERRIKETGLSERVSMPGMAVDGFKAACYARTNVFAQPSEHENFGLSVAEALMFRLPCIVSDGVALADDIAEAGAGIVCPSTVDSFEENLRKIISSRESRSTFSEAAVRLAERFKPETVATRLDAEYHQCIRDHTAGRA